MYAGNESILGFFICSTNEKIVDMTLSVCRYGVVTVLSDVLDYKDLIAERGLFNTNTNIK